MTKQTFKPIKKSPALKREINKSFEDVESKIAGGDDHIVTPENMLGKLDLGFE